MFWRYVIAMVITVIAILLAVILGDYGPWYLSWLLGTGFMVLLAVSAGVLFEAQDDAERGISEPIIKLDDETAAESAKN
ncbi:hypothetical protein ACT6QH_13910 [Xanthobacter sp. TB0139]|uniref:hypothetical protein n=1 Tax=Xanthobacter sp. TB0139 TaxID=3459178 RepID=UPI0040396510